VVIGVGLLVCCGVCQCSVGHMQMGAETSVSCSTLFLCEMVDLFQALKREIRLNYV